MEFITDVVCTFAALVMACACVCQLLDILGTVRIGQTTEVEAEAVAVTALEEDSDVEYYYYVVDGRYNTERIMRSAHEYRRGTEGCDMATALRKTWGVAHMEMARYKQQVSK